MSTRRWQEEFEALAAFSRDLETRPALPEASPEELAAHAEQVARTQDVLSLVAVLPASARPPVMEWDDLLGPLWRRLFARGDDVTRYILADLWRGVLLEAGCKERFYRSSTAVAASARDFYRFEEALTVCQDARKAADGEESAALANLLNTEGTVHVCRGNYAAAEAAYNEALGMAERLGEAAFTLLPGPSRQDFLAQELINLFDCYLHRGHAETGAERVRVVKRARKFYEQLLRMPFSEDYRQLHETNLGELLILEGKIPEARTLLTAELEAGSHQGPYALSLSAMRGRLLSCAAELEGEWGEAYRWIRWALKTGTTHTYPAEEQFVLEQAIAVLRGLHEVHDIASTGLLVEDLSLLLEDKDWYTGSSHSRNVGRRALLLGKLLKESCGWDLDLDILSKAGLLHDIGKLRLPWSLLNKIAPIAPKEWDLLRDHSAYGAGILEEMGMGEVGQVVLQHHETLDGSGYPNHRPPDRMASIVAVCDAFEAATTPNRRYKVPKRPAEMLGEFKREAGRLYHPDVVEALATLVHSQEAL